MTWECGFPIRAFKTTADSSGSDVAKVVHLTWGLKAESGKRKAKTMFKIRCIALVPVLLIAGYVIYWDSKLRPLMEHAALDIMPGAYEINNGDGIQLVDLGYATFNVPEKYDLAPHVDGVSSVIALRVKDEKLEDVFLHPFRLELEDFGDEFSGYFADRFDSAWDLQTEALYSQRFSFWSFFSTVERN